MKKRNRKLNTTNWGNVQIYFSRNLKSRNLNNETDKKTKHLKLEKLNKKEKPRPTAVTRDLGIWLNLNMVLFQENLCISEKTRIFNPKPRVAPRRYVQA